MEAQDELIDIENRAELVRRIRRFLGLERHLLLFDKESYYTYVISYDQKNDAKKTEKAVNDFIAAQGVFCGKPAQSTVVFKSYKEYLEIITEIGHSNVPSECYFLIMQTTDQILLRDSCKISVNGEYLSEMRNFYGDRKVKSIFPEVEEK